MRAGCTLSDREADSEVRSWEYPRHGECGSLTALILATYIFFSSSLRKRVSNVKSNTRVASSNLERSDGLRQYHTFCLVLQQSTCLYRIYMPCLLDKIAPGVFSFDLHVQPFSLDRVRVLISFPGPPLLYSASSFKRD